MPQDVNRLAHVQQLKQYVAQSKHLLLVTSLIPDPVQLLELPKCNLWGKFDSLLISEDF